MCLNLEFLYEKQKGQAKGKYLLIVCMVPLQFVNEYSVRTRKNRILEGSVHCSRLFFRSQEK